MSRHAVHDTPLQRRDSRTREEKLTRHIRVLEDLLAEMYERRRGLPTDTIDGTLYWCELCGQVPVDVERRKETACNACTTPA
jgi:hypothetical protein